MSFHKTQMNIFWCKCADGKMWHRNATSTLQVIWSVPQCTILMQRGRWFYDYLQNQQLIIPNWQSHRYLNQQIAEMKQFWNCKINTKSINRMHLTLILERNKYMEIFTYYYVSTKIPIHYERFDTSGFHLTAFLSFVEEKQMCDTPSGCHTSL